MSNDELQRAIDDITSEKNVLDGNDSGTAAVELPAEMTGGLDAERPEIPSLGAMPETSAEPAMGGVGAPVSPAMPDLSNNPFANLNAKDEGLPTLEPMSGGIGGENGLGNAPVSAPEGQEGGVLGGLGYEQGLGISSDMGVPGGLEDANSKPVEAPSMDANAILDNAMDEMKASVPLPEVEMGDNPDDELNQIKNDVLMELYPLLGTMNLGAKEKFDFCMKVVDKTKDKGALRAAFEAAKGMDGEEKGEALMKLIETIDKM